MSVKSGQNIIEDGLIVHVDFNNFKSNGGKPTTNLATYPDTDPLQTINMVGLVNKGVVEGGWIKYGLSGQWTGGTYPYMFALRSVSYTANLDYTASCEIYTDIPSGLVTGDFSINYVNDINMPSGGNLNRNQTNVRKPMKVYRRNFIYSINTSQVGYFVFRGLGTPTFDPDKHHVYIRNVQIERGTHPTPLAGKHRTKPDGVLTYTTRGNANQDAMVNLAGSTYPVQFDTTLNWVESNARPTDGNVDFDNINRYPRFDSDTNSNVYFNGLNPTLMPSSASWAYEVWYKPDQYPQPLASPNQYGNTTKAGFIIGASSYNGHGLRWTGNTNGTAMGVTAFYRTPNGGYSASDYYYFSEPELSKWHHIMMVHDSDSTSPPIYYLYVNGVKVASRTYSEESSTYTGTIGLGRPHVDGGGTLNYRSMEGYVGEARVYNNKLFKDEDVVRNYIATRDKYDYWRG